MSVRNTLLLISCRTLPTVSLMLFALWVILTMDALLFVIAAVVIPMYILFTLVPLEMIAEASPYVRERLGPFDPEHEPVKALLRTIVVVFLPLPILYVVKAFIRSLL